MILGTFLSFIHVKSILLLDKIPETYIFHLSLTYKEQEAEEADLEEKLNR